MGISRRATTLRVSLLVLKVPEDTATKVTFDPRGLMFALVICDIVLLGRRIRTLVTRVQHSFLSTDVCELVRRQVTLAFECPSATLVFTNPRLLLTVLHNMNSALLLWYQSHCSHLNFAE